MRKNHFCRLLLEDNAHETSYSCSHLNGPGSRACAGSSRARPDPLWNASHARSCSVAFTVSHTYSHRERHAITQVQQYNGSSADLVVGDQIRLQDLLYGLMLPSGDDAAIAIADAVGGTTSNFVRTMNLFAKRLHLTQTHYINPDGLTYLTPQGRPDPNQYSSAADLAHLTRFAMANPFFAQLVELQHYILPASAVHHAYTWDSINTLLSTYPGATGVKTGYTMEAGYCLVFAATNGQHHLIGVLLHEPNAAQRFADARTLLNWGFALPLLPPTSYLHDTQTDHCKMLKNGGFVSLFA